MTNQNTYNRPPQGQMMPQMGQPMMSPQMHPLPPMPHRAPRNNGGWRQRLLSGNTGRPLTLQQERTIPSWVVGSSVAVFVIAMVACWMSFGYMPTMNLWLTSAISIIIFFYAGSSMSRSWSNTSEKRFCRNVFVTGFAIRFIFVLYMYLIFNPEYYGTTFGDKADTGWYMDFGKELALWLTGNTDMSLASIRYSNAAAFDDTGYPMWLGLIYVITGPDNDVFVPFLLKCLMGAYCALSIYRVAKRHFGEGTARIAAIFICVNPNLIYWCSTMLKETEMVFLCCLAIDNFDRVLTSGQRFAFKSLLPGVLAASALMFFRSALGLVIFIAVFAHIVMASQRVMSMGKKIIAGVLVGSVLLVAMGDRIRTQTRELVESVKSDKQQVNMEWRGKREGGNTFAKYAGTAVFAPLIFTIPFPTFNQANETQLLQVQLSGGSYIKNIMSYFVIWVMFIMLISGEWRKHVFIIAYTVGYLMVLVMSNFAQSGRFHMPVWPMLMLFAAYGIQIAKTNGRVRKWFPFVLVLEVVACLAWNWFKLKGRGMI